MQKYASLKIVLNLKRQYFSYEKYVDRLKIDEIITYVFMYMGPSISFLHYEPLKSDVNIFNTFSGLKTRFHHFPTRRAYFFLKLKFRIFLTFIVLQRLQAFL